MLAFFNDRGLSDLFFSPFIIPVAGCLTGLGIVLGGIYAGIRSREMQSRERLALIASGQPIPPTLEELAIIHGAKTKVAQRDDGRGARRAGIVLLSVGLGIAAFFVALALILQVRGVLCGAAVGLIPLLMGVGFLVDARINSREAAREAAQEAAREAEMGVGGFRA